ncbi:MAG: methyltransferase domain-containing protein [Dehalococcoidia bacterium]
MRGDTRRVCPAEHAGWLVNPIRKWFQNPEKLLKGYVKEGMTVLDVGCGPGFFSIAMATMVGKTGRVIAADVQEAMLERLKKRIAGQEVEDRIQLHLAKEERIGLSEAVDFALAFYMIHEVPDQDAFLQELKSTLKPNGKLLVVEPMFHVSKKAFEETIARAKTVGFVADGGPGVFFSRSVILRRE